MSRAHGREERSRNTTAVAMRLGKRAEPVIGSRPLVGGLDCDGFRRHTGRTNGELAARLRRFAFTVRAGGTLTNTDVLISLAFGSVGAALIGRRSSRVVRINGGLIAICLRLGRRGYQGARR
jgi:hypothetical protein